MLKILTLANVPQTKFFHPSHLCLIDKYYIISFYTLLPMVNRNFVLLDCLLMMLSKKKIGYIEVNVRQCKDNVETS